MEGSELGALGDFAPENEGSGLGASMDASGSVAPWIEETPIGSKVGSLLGAVEKTF
jgi:hypothetical protein